MVLSGVLCHAKTGQPGAFFLKVNNKNMTFAVLGYALSLIGIIGVPILLGIFLDEALHTAPIFTLLGVFLGIFGSFLGFYSIISKK